MPKPIKPLADMTKAELLAEIERIPQHFWPPRPTRQDKATLVLVLGAYYAAEINARLRAGENKCN